MEIGLISFVNMYAVGLPFLAASPLVILQLSDFLSYNAPSSIHPAVSSEKTKRTQPEILVCLSDCYSILHFIVWVVTLAGRTGSLPYGGVMELNCSFVQVRYFVTVIPLERN